MDNHLEVRDTYEAPFLVVTPEGEVGIQWATAHALAASYRARLKNGDTEGFTEVEILSHMLCQVAGGNCNVGYFKGGA